MKKRLKKADLIFLGIVLFLGLAGMWAVRMFQSEDGGAVRITVDGTVYGTYDLDQAQTIPIEKNGTVTNTLRIQDGQAKMMEADCPDRLCMRQKAVSRQGETIVCLPNKIVVEIEGGAPAELDATAQ